MLQPRDFDISQNSCVKTLHLGTYRAPRAGFVRTLSVKYQITRQQNRYYSSENAGSVGDKFVKVLH